MSLLDEIITASTDDSVSTSNLLRKVQVVAHRLGATDILAWVQRELDGYTDMADMPSYRRMPINVRGEWSGPRGSTWETLSAGRIPSDAKDVLFSVALGASVAELEENAASTTSKEMAVPWDPQHVALYNGWVDEGLVPHVMFHRLFSANRVITKGVLRGIIDASRNRALGFALDLQTAAPDAGEVAGPTMEAGPVRKVVNKYYVTHIRGDGNQVAHGDDIRQTSKVVKNDLPALLAAASELGLSSEGSEELARAVLADEAERPSRIKVFLGKVSEGAFLIGTGAAGNVAATQLTALIAAYQG